MNKNIALVVGGSYGIGLSLTLQLISQGYEKIYIIDRSFPAIELPDFVEYHQFNLLNEDYSIFDSFVNINTLIITSGFGRVATFDNLQEKEIINQFKVNALSVCIIIKKFYLKINSAKPFYCAVMGSISGLISSPLFSTYGATKSAVCSFIESLNIELEKDGTRNRILNVSPGIINGTAFNGGKNDLAKTQDLAKEIINRMKIGDTLYIPNFDIYGNVLERYRDDPHKFGIEIYDYKIINNRLTQKPQLRIGYLSGTFDLFHIGHLIILMRAKEYCDFLVVGVHKDSSHKGKETYIPFEERKRIVESCKYVDKVIESCREDCDVFDFIKYDYLFVGSDYKGSDRFNRYEEYFKDKGVQIIYFPYTKGTSSTQLRMAIDTKLNNYD